MGITYGDHLIDSGYYDITPEQEREIEERKGTEMTDVCEQLREESLRLARLSFDRADAGIAANVVDAAIDEIDRLQEAKRRALKLAVEHAHETNALAQALTILANAEALTSVRQIVAGWNGDGREGAPFKRHPDNLGATIPKTRCKAIYDLDEAIERAKTLLAGVGCVQEHGKD